MEVDLVAEMTVINPFDFFLEPYAEKYPFCYEPGLRKELDAVSGRASLPGRNCAAFLASHRPERQTAPSIFWSA